MIGGRFRVAVLLGGLLLVAGCSGSGSSPEPIETPATSETSTPVGTVSAEPEIEVPVAPAAEKTAKGAEEFVRYFWEVYNYGYASLDATPVANLSNKSCKFCSSAMAEIESFKGSSTQREGGEIDTETISAPPVENPSRILVISIINQAAGRTVSSNGDSNPIPPIRRAQASVGLEWHAGSWRVHGISIETA